MASGIIGNDVPRKGLRVRVPCPPLQSSVRFSSRTALLLRGKALLAVVLPTLVISSPLIRKRLVRQAI